MTQVDTGQPSVEQLKQTKRLDFLHTRTCLLQYIEREKEKGNIIRLFSLVMYQFLHNVNNNTQ